MNGPHANISTPRKARLRSIVADAGGGDHEPGVAEAGLPATVAAVALIVDRHRYFSPMALREHVLERRHARAQVADLDADAGGLHEDRLLVAGAPVLLGETGRHEDAHHVLVGGVAVHAAVAQHLDERRQVPLDAQLEDPPGRSLELGDRPLRRDLPLVHDDHVSRR